MTAPDPGIDIRGAVDLSALAAPADAPAPASGGLVVEATATTFNALVEQSATVPVVVDLYSPRSQESVQLSATLSDLTQEYGGKFLLARVNADSEADIVAAVGAQTLPTTIAIVKGQPVPLFQGAHEAAQIRQVLDELLRVAAENGVTGTLDVGEPEPEAEVEEPLPPHLQEAYDAIEREDFDGAIAAFKKGLANNPADAESKAGLVQVELLQRIEGHDPAHVLASAGSIEPGSVEAGDLEAHLLAADVEVSQGQFAAAFDRLLAVIKATGGAEREATRSRLVELFLLAPEGSPEVAESRKQLALTLF